MTRRLLGPVGGSVLFAAVAGLVFAGLGWVTVAALRVEREREEAAARAELANHLRVALWRLDGRLLPALSGEDARPFHHYLAHAPGAEPLGTTGPGCAALLSAELPDWMVLHVEFDPAAGWKSPQVLPADAADDLRDRWPGLPLRNVTPGRAALLDLFQARYPAGHVGRSFAAREKAAAGDGPAATVLFAEARDAGREPRPPAAAAPAPPPGGGLAERREGFTLEQLPATADAEPQRRKDATLDALSARPPAEKQAAHTADAPSDHFAAGRDRPPAGGQAATPYAEFANRSGVVQRSIADAKGAYFVPYPQTAAPPAAEGPASLALNNKAPVVPLAAGGAAGGLAFAPPPPPATGGMPSGGFGGAGINGGGFGPTPGGGGPVAAGPAGPAAQALAAPGGPGMRSFAAGGRPPADDLQAAKRKAPPATDKAETGPAGVAKPAADPKAEAVAGRKPGPEEAGGKSAKKDDAVAREESMKDADANAAGRGLGRFRQTAPAGPPAAAATPDPVAGGVTEAEAVTLGRAAARPAAPEAPADAAKLGAVAPPAAVHLGSMRPQWLTAADGSDALLLVRAVRAGPKVTYQGVVLDWPRVRALLLDEVKDLFPAADLVPVKDPAGVPAERTMAALPVQLDPGPAPPPVPPGWTPLRLGLALAWAAAVIAVGAVGLAGWSLIDLSERRIRFVSAVTHELRTPLTSLRLYLDLLVSGLVTDEAKKAEYLATLNAESDRLHRLIDNVLDFARLERRRAGHPLRPVPVADLMDRVRRTWADRCGADGKDLVVVSTLPPAAAAWTDPDLFGQIVGNLIDNARKYAREASDPRIWVWAKPAGRKRLAFEVEDRGPGVPPGERGLIFRPFRRGEGADTTAGGAGLGLALARQWAEVGGGRLTYRPADGGTGACFRLELPAA